MERVSAFQPLPCGRRQSAFRKLITEISEHLLPGEVTKCSFIHNLPKERSSSALDTLESLMQGGMFSHSNVEPLVDLLKDINRHDLVNEQVESFRRDFYDEDELSQSLPAPLMTQQIPLERRSNTVPADTAHAGIPPSLAVQETAPIAPSQTVNKTPAPTLQRPSSHEFSNSLTRQERTSTPQSPEMPPLSAANSPQPVYADPSPESGEAPTPHRPRIYTPVKWNDVGVSPHHKFKECSPSNSSSFNELQCYANQSSEHLLESSHMTRPYSQPEEYPSAATPTDTPTTPNGNGGTQLKLRRGAHLSHKAQSGLFMAATPLSMTSQHPQQKQGARSLSESRPRRAMTPPANLNKRISEPNFSHHNSFIFHSLARQTNARPESRTSGWSEASQPSPSRFPVDHTHQDDCDVFPHSQQSSQADGNEATQGHTGATEGRPDSGKLFRKRPGSKKRILNKFTRSRDRSSSIVTWSVKRRKLNEAIYEHRREKLLKCPRGLELENGGKHPPRLTLYLHPYGYEDDARKNLTLTVTLEASVKSHIPSSAVIRMEIFASETTEGRKLNHAILECQADSRIVRYKGFLSHKELRELECESIEFTASAKLYTTSLTD